MQKRGPQRAAWINSGKPQRVTYRGIMVDSLPIRLRFDADIRSCPGEWDTATGRWRCHGASLSKSLKDVTSASVEVNKNFSTAFL
jgi:hypothetical protein